MEAFMPESLRLRANGIQIHYLRQGGGPSLILLHGWPEFSGVWERCMAELADRFELFAPDRRSFRPTPETLISELVCNSRSGLLARGDRDALEADEIAPRCNPPLE
jgi:pimeloyl-ACP methyl ester carboxylesterase